MGLYTNEGLVKHVKAALQLKTKYMWAGTLNPITDAYITQKVNQCKAAGVSGSYSGYTDARIKQLRELAGKGFYGVDCVCLIKSYYWSGKADGGTGSPKYTGSNDVNANVMYQRATVKGPISTMPEIPGLIVYSKSHPHVGIYIGNGYTIESTLGSRGDGVVKRKLDSLWEYWFQCPYINYVTTATTSPKTKKCTLVFPAKVRSEPKSSAKLLGRLTPGNTVTIVIGSETKDSKSGLTYVRIDGEPERWIVVSALG